MVERRSSGDENVNPDDQGRNLKQPRYNDNSGRSGVSNGGLSGIENNSSGIVNNIGNNSLTSGGSVGSRSNIGGLRDSQDALGLLNQSNVSTNSGVSNVKQGGFGSMLFGGGKSSSQQQPQQQVPPVAPKPSKGSRFGRLASFGAGLFGRSSSSNS